MNLQSLFLSLILAAAFGVAAREVSRVWPADTLGVIIAASAALCGIAAAGWAVAGRRRRRAWWLYGLVGVFLGGFAAVLVLLPATGVSRTAWTFAGMNSLMIVVAALMARKNWRGVKENSEPPSESFDAMTS